jgi:dTDP-4-amino-4,6-dideoxygalactose transaminase
MTTSSHTAPDRPAAMGGAPAFPEGLRFVNPRVPDASLVTKDVEKILGSGILTNGPFVKAFEAAAADYLGVRQCVAVSSCTAGLMLVLRASDLSGSVVVPSFTFTATAHAPAWNGLRPVFADIDRSSLTLSPQSVRHAIGVRTSAILATHTFGTPADVESLTALARARGVRLFFDAAHAFGSTRSGTKVGGFGDAEVFSLSPTKVVVSGEGGIVATNDEVLAERIRIGRDYANPGDYDCRFVGMNARMSEFHAAVGLRSLDGLDERLARRNELVDRYRSELGGLPGISFAEVSDGDRSTFKDFTVLVEADEFGVDAARLATMLAAEGVETKRYYTPPVHQQRAYLHLGVSSDSLPVTMWAAARVLTLPLWADLTDEQVSRVAEAVGRIHVAARRAA